MYKKFGSTSDEVQGYKYSWVSGETKLHVPCISCSEMLRFGGGGGKCYLNKKILFINILLYNNGIITDYYFFSSWSVSRT